MRRKESPVIVLMPFCFSGLSTVNDGDEFSRKMCLIERYMYMLDNYLYRLNKGPGDIGDKYM